MYDPDSETEYECNQMLDVQEVYRELMTACLLTLVLRHLALSYHGPDAARSRSVDALDHSFALEAPVWPSETIH
jgi:hypothetical protein